VVANAADDPPAPIHLDDIHFMVSSDAATVAWLEQRLGACEMAHPGQPIDYVRYLSVRYGDPTLTVTGPTPANEPDPLRAATTGHVDIVPAADASPHYGIYWVALRTRDLAAARSRFPDATPVQLPHEPATPALRVAGPDNVPLVIVERPGDTGSPFGIDHLVMLVSDVAATARFLGDVFAGQVLDGDARLRVLRIADARLVLVEPERVALDRAQVAPVPNIPWASGAVPSRTRVAVPASVEHLGFLYADVPAMAAAARARGYTPVYPPFRYAYRGRPTAFTVTEFMSPDGFGVEAVSAEGRVGPHAYYRGACATHE
jgi:hypothetical protein